MFLLSLARKASNLRGLVRTGALILGCLAALGLLISGAAIAAGNEGSPPDVDYAAVLDSPELVWAEAAGNTVKPAGVAMEGLRGGAGVVVGRTSSLKVVLGKRTLIRIRESGGAYLGSTWDYSAVLATETIAGAQWRTRAYSLPAGTHLLSSSALEAWVDYVEVIPEPASVEEALGLVASGFTFGGDAPWRTVTSLLDGMYMAGTSLTAGLNQAWIEHEVTGPAEVSFRYYGYSNSSGPLKVLVDGKPCWDSSLSHLVNEAGLALVEIPPGTHKIRYLAERIGPYFGDVTARVSSITVVPLPEGGRIGKFLGAAIPSGRNGSWSGVTGLGGDLRDALVPVSKWDYYGEKPRLRLAFSGPGTVRFDSYFPVSTASSIAGIGAQLSIVSSLGTSVARSGGDGFGWRSHSLWLPQGNHYLTMEARGALEDTSRMAISGLKFQPDPVMTVTEAFGLEGTSTIFSPADYPWEGIQKPGAAKPVVVSPGALSTVPKKMAVTVNGPGEISFYWEKFVAGTPTGTFRVNGETVATLALSEMSRRKVTAFISQTGPVTLEWEISTYWDYGGWLELSDFSWKPWEESPLPGALDAEHLVWRTSPDNPVTGRETSGAFGGTAANALLEHGGQTWLETTVEGSGIFGFSVVKSRANPTYGSSSVAVAVDGRLEQQYGGSYISLVLGDGPHTIRIWFQNDRSDLRSATAVDRVTWQPRSRPDAEQGWTESVPEAVGVFPGYGKNGAEAIILIPSLVGQRWIEKEITGPGRLNWSNCHSPGVGYQSVPRLTVDGVEPAQRSPRVGEWEQHGLDLPAGTHLVRFSLSVAALELAEGENTELPSWRISGMGFTPGIPPLMQGLDHESSAWLTVGDNQGSYLPAQYVYDHQDKWQPGYAGVISFINVLDKRVLASSRLNGSANAEAFVRRRMVDARSSVVWNDPVGGSWPGLIDEFTAVEAEEVPTEEGMDHIGELHGAGWKGIAFPETGSVPDDAAVSMLNQVGENDLSVTVQGPATVRFRWKCEGGAKLFCGLDGRWASAAFAGSGWTDVELQVEPGSHVLSWHHLAAVGGITAESTGWLDQLVVEPLPESTVAQALMAEGEAPVPVVAGPGWRVLSQRAEEGGRKVLAVDGSDTSLNLQIADSRIVSISAWTSPLLPVLVPGEIPKTSGSGVWTGNRWLEVRVGDAAPIYFQLQSYQVGSDIPGSGVTFLVPAGGAEVTLRAVVQNYEPETGGLIWSPLPSSLDTRLSVDDLRLARPDEHYRAWTDLHELGSEASASGDDTDGDSYTNLMEYAMGLNPNTKDSDYHRLYLWLEPAWDGEGNQILLSCPGFLPHVGVQIERSEDLVHWRPVAAQEDRMVIPGAVPWGRYLTLPEEPGRAGSYFRMRFEIPGND